MVDQNGACSAEWYRFFVQIQRMIGGPSNPFDDSGLLNALPVGSDNSGQGNIDVLTPPMVPVVGDDPLVPPAVTTVGDDLMHPYIAQALFGLDAAARRIGYRTMTASGNAEQWDRVILVDTTAGAVTVTLPTVASSDELVLCIKKTSANANNMVIDGNGAETIDGAANITTATQWASYTLLGTAAGWMVL